MCWPFVVPATGDGGGGFFLPLFATRSFGGGGGDFNSGFPPGLTGAGYGNPPPPHLAFAQSKGRIASAVHCLVGLCPAIPGMQFPLPSNTTPLLPAHSGASPEKKFPEKVKFRSLGSLQTWPGTKPVRLFCPTSSCSTLISPPDVAGIGPCSRLKLTSNTVRFRNLPTSGGIQPERLSLRRIISLSVFSICPILDGIHPPRSLFARTTTETGELPRFRGMPARRRLELRKMASRGRLKRAEGIRPSNSLNRKSR